MHVSKRVRGRRASAADVANVRNLWQASLRILAASTYDRVSVECLIRDAGTVASRLIEDGTMVVLELEGEIVACGGWTACLPAGRATIECLYVDPGFAGEGLGTQLIGILEREIADAGYSEARIAATLNAMPFCAKAGYRPHGLCRRSLTGRPDIISVDMTKPLAARVAAAA